jgi:hypothetical protein
MYREHSPGKRLARAVACYWTTTSTGNSHRVLPDGCIDIVLRRTRTSESFCAQIVGAMSTAVVVDDPPCVEYLGIRFAPAEAFRFLALPAHEATDQVVPLEAVWGRMASELESRVSDAKDETARLSVVEEVLEHRLRSAAPGDFRLRQAIAAMHWPESRFADWDIGLRQMRRLFKTYVGLSPKAFARILRMQRAVSMIGRGTARTGAELAVTCGYFDQSHLVREFHALTGLSPRAFAKAQSMTVLSNPPANSPAIG